MSDYFTRWVEAYGIPNQEATTVAHKIVEEFFFRFGLPEQLHSDQGRNFESEVVSEVCKILEIAKTRTTPYHPQSDGLVERLNRTLLNMLAMTTADHPSQWECHLRSLCMAYNTSIQSTTGYTPFYLMLGRQARMPVEIMYGSPTLPVRPVTEYAIKMKESIEHAYQQVREKMEKNLNREKELYDKRIHGRQLDVDDLVWLHCPAVPRGCSRKLHHPWKGPFRVIKKLSNVLYSIQNVKKRQQKLIVHFNRLKYCSSNMRELSKQATMPSKPKTKSSSPVGTNLHLIDDNDNTSDNVNSNGENQNSNMGPPTNGAPIVRNHPRRNRKPPDYYHNEI